MVDQINLYDQHSLPNNSAGLGHGGKVENELLHSAKPVMIVNFVCYLGQAIIPRYLIKH